MSLVEIRAAHPGDEVRLARLHVAVWRETYAQLLPQEVARLDEGLRVERWRRDLGEEAAGRRFAQTRLLLIDGLPSGFVTAGRQRHRALAELGYDAEIWALYLLAAHQGRGFGRRLVEAAAADLAARSHWALSVQVLASNLPAAGFYGHLGGREVARLGAGQRAERSFAWEDLQELLPDRMRVPDALPPGWAAP